MRGPTFAILALTLMLGACASNPTQLQPTVRAPEPVASPGATQPPASPMLAQAVQPSPEVPEPEPAAPGDPPIAVPFDPDRVRLELEPAWGGFTSPVGMTSAGDDSGRRFVLEQPGRVRVVQQDRLADPPYLDITPIVGSRGNEQGLLGIAFHPRFVENRFLYVNYTDTNGDTVVARYTEGPDGMADPSSALVLLRQDQPFSNHNGGHLAFGPDGYLWIGLGDGGSANDPRDNAQNLQTLLGKLLRIDVDSAAPYGVPPDNPFVGDPQARPEIWSYGLRNPWRFSFDEPTGLLFVADVGQNAWEEVNAVPLGQPGLNYGWKVMEGAHCRGGGACDTTDRVLPVAEYGRGDGCSVTGGYVYRGEAFPDMSGAFYFGDFCSGRVWALWQSPDGAWQTRQVLRADVQISSFGVDEAGELYVLGRGDGVVYRLVDRGP